MLLCGRRSKGGLGVALVRASCSTTRLLTLLSSSRSFQRELARQSKCGRGAHTYNRRRENGRPASKMRGLSASIKECVVVRSRQSIATRFASLRDAKLIPFASTICFCCVRLINLTKTEQVSMGAVFPRGGAGGRPWPGPCLHAPPRTSLDDCDGPSPVCVRSKTVAAY